MKPNLDNFKVSGHISGFVNVENHAYWQKLFRYKLRLQETHGTISRSAVKKDQNERKVKSQANIIEQRGTDAAKLEQTERKVKSRDKIIVEKGPGIIQKEHNAWKSQRRKRKLEENSEALHINEQSRKKLA